MNFRIGHGYDVHRLVEGRPLIIGGVHIPCPYGLLGHSDGDVLIHAFIDAILGAAGLGDIGGRFPDSDDKYKGASSLWLLEQVAVDIKGSWKIENIDSTIVAQAPKMAEYKSEMEVKISGVLDIPIKNVNIKATTEEGLGFTGRGEGIAAHAVCLIAPHTRGN